MKQQGAFWHGHHLELIEWCHSYNERAEYIRTKKAVGEREIRLRLFRPVKGILPDAALKALATHDKAWTASNKALATYDKARDARDKARDAYDKARVILKKANAALNKVQDARDKAIDAYDKACATLGEALKTHWLEIEALHRAECRDCSWNGQTIFP